MPVEALKPDTYEVERLSAKTAKFLQEKLWGYLNDIYIKWKDGKLRDVDFHENFVKFSIDIRDKLRELKEIDKVTKIKEVLHFG